MRFSYRATDSHGQTRTGVIEASTQASALMALRSRRFQVDEIREWDGDAGALRPPSPRPPSPQRRRIARAPQESRGWNLAFAAVGLLLAFSLLRFATSYTGSSEDRSGPDEVQMTVRTRLAPPAGERLPEGVRVHLVYPDIPYEVEATPRPDGSVEIAVSALSQRPAGRFHVELSRGNKRWRVASDQLVGTQTEVELPALTVQEPEEPVARRRPARQRPGPARERSTGAAFHRRQKAAKKPKRGDRSP